MNAKPCPFCGEKIEIRPADHIEISAEDEIWVATVCGNCDAHGPLSREEPGNDDATRHNSLLAWNSRSEVD